MQFRQRPAFAKQLKRLKKKYRSLDADLGILEKVLLAQPRGVGENHWDCLHLSPDRKIAVYKVRLSCAAMQGETRFRVIYAYNESSQTIAFVDFVEIYFKGDKENEDKSLIAEYIQEFE